MSDRLWDKQEHGSSPDDQVEAFTVGNDYLIDRHILADDCWASITHAATLVRAGILQEHEFSRIQETLLSLIERHEREGVDIDRSQEDCHTAIEQHLTDELGELGKKIHTGRSRNDQVLTAVRLFTKRRLLDVATELETTVSRLLARAEDGRRSAMRGYSHTRPAMPTTVAVWLGGYAELLLDDFERLRNAFQLNDRSPLGSAAGFGSVIPLDRDLAQRLLGFGDLQVNSLTCQTGRGKAEGAVVSALESVQTTLDTLARDMILYSAGEFGFLELPRELTTGSSIMPQKRNPDVLELIRGKTGIVVGSAAQIQRIGTGLTSGYHRDYQLLKEPLIVALATVTDCLEMMSRVLTDMILNEEAMRASCTREIYAADLALDNAREGTPFRDAYREAMDQLEQIDVDDEFVSSRIDAYVTIGSMGNPALERYELRVAELRTWVDEQRKAQLSTKERLRQPIEL